MILPKLEDITSFLSLFWLRKPSEYTLHFQILDRLQKTQN